ncbi:MAG: SPOR domain-containing protein [Lewinellaceae bacterium]|nr:SPOR domain-containing protein [Lewinellaceae bacterium]
MSRLDYVTIAIVAVCIAALVYLIYMTTNLLGDSGEPESTTETTQPATSSEDVEDDTYYFNDEGRIAGDEQSGGQPDAGSTDSNGSSDYDYQTADNLDKSGNASSGSKATRTPDELDSGSSIAEESYTTKGNTSASSGSASTSSNTRSSTGEYMVMAGTFTVKAYAQDMEKKLRSLGYNNVELEPFDQGKYTVVLVDRFSSIDEAKSLASELKGKGIDSYVKRK